MINELRKRIRVYMAEEKEKLADLVSLGLMVSLRGGLAAGAIEAYQKILDEMRSGGDEKK